MKKNTFILFVLIAFGWQSNAQTLNQNAAWPNASWSVTGIFNTDPLAYEADPITTSNFAFDDDDAGSGSDDSIAAESPIIDLTAASTAGETWITVSGDYVYRYLSNDVLELQYWDADATAWVSWTPGFTASTAGAPTNDYCTATSEAYVTDVLNIAAFTPTQLSGFRYRIFYDDDPSGADYNYGFCFQSPTITSATPPSCPDPVVLTASTILSNSANLGWTEAGSASAWDIELVDITASATPTGTATSTGVANPYNQMGLASANDYEFYVRANCGVDGVSNWVGPFAFTTACSIFTAPYAEGFENAGTVPNCWEMSGDENWLFANSGGGHIGDNGTLTGTTATNGYFAWVDASGTQATAVLLSPFVDVSGLAVAALSFYEISDNEGNANSSLEVEVWDGAAWNSMVTYTTNTSGWEQKFIDLSGLTITGNVQARFTFSEIVTGDFYDDIAIDDVSFDELPSCVGPSALTATAIDGFSAVLGWTNGGSEALWDIELVDLTAGGTATGSATITGVTNTYDLTGLTPVNNYEYYVRADCGGSTSTWSGPFAFTTTVACPEPSALAVTNVLTTSADLGWTVGGSEMAWDIELVDLTAGGTATGTPTSTGVANPYNQGGLTAANDYEFYVRADCTTNGTSTWVGPFAFTTACSVFTAPYSEGFENAGTVPNCWEMSGDENWLFANSGGGHIGNNGTLTGTTATNGYFAWVDASGSQATAVLLSPFVDVSGLAVPALSFYEISDNEGNANSSLEVEVWDGAAWNSMVTYTTNTSGWEQKFIDLGGLTITGNVQARFTFSEIVTGDFYDDIAIDDVSFDELPSCVGPSALTATAIDGFSAVLGWTNGGSEALWDIELVDLTAGGTATGTATTTGVTNTYDLTGLTPVNNYEYYVRADCGGSTSTWSGPFAFTTTVACPEPSALAVTNVLTTSADLGWTVGGSEMAWDIELVDLTAGGIATGTPTSTGVANPYNQGGLIAANDYEFYVRADCTTNGTSTWAGPFNFTTACSTFVAPYSEGFENAGAIPTCWEMSGGENWLFANTGGFNHIGNNGTLTGTTATNGYFAWVDASGTAAAAELLSPFVDVSGLSVPALSFYEISDNEGNANSNLLVEVWDGAAWNTVGTYNTNTSGWEQRIIDLSGLTITGDIQVRFTFDEIIAPNDHYDDIAIDDITIDELPSCVAPASLAVTILSTTSVDLSWTETGSALAWQYVVQADGTGVPAGAGTSTGSNPVNVSSLTANTAYEFYVRADCGSGDFSDWIGPIAFFTGTCVPAAGSSSSSYIDNFTTTNGAVNISNLTSGFSADNYGDNYSTMVVSGSANSSFDFNVEIVGGTLGCAIWVDWNNDLMFDTATETMFNTTSYGNGPFTGTITIPDGTLNGDYKLRVMVDWNDSNPDDDACALASGRGEIEDYKITVDSSLSVTDLDNGLTFRSFPNPVTNVLSIRAQQNIQAVHIFNMLGQEVLRTSPNTMDTDVDMSVLQSGAYFVKVTINDVTETVKIIKR